jgi:rSAM/selenodomain-associated transferase 2
VTLSIIVPALNEAPRIPSLSRHLAAVVPSAELWLVDGGSHDGTAEVAEEAGFSVLRTERGRGRQMNAGAAAATGSTLLFLHADTKLPVGAAAAVSRCLEAGVTVGAFTLRLDDRRPSLRLIEVGIAARCRILHLPLGDQALFCTRDGFDGLGGFNELPFLEDLDFVDRARKQGTVAMLPDQVVTSARQWLQRGVWRTTAWNGWVTGRYLRGWRPQVDPRAPGTRGPPTADESGVPQGVAAADKARSP